MPATSGRWEFLRQAGRFAVRGLLAAVRGVDLVIDPGPPAVSAAPAASDAAAVSGAPAVAGAAAVSGAPAVAGAAAAAHRIAGAERAGAEAAAAAPDELPPLRLALFPGAGASLPERALGLTGRPLAPLADLEEQALAHDLAWLPLAIGLPIYRQTAGGRLLAVGGYQRAALVRFSGAPATAAPALWCALGDDALAICLPPGGPALLQEEPERLRQAIAAGRVAAALLGGALLQWALAQPGAAVAQALAAPEGLPWVPVWGLFTRGREPLIGRLETEEVALAPAHALPGLAALLQRFPGV